MLVRTVYTSDRLEMHAAACGHRIPRTAEVAHTERMLEDLQAIHDEAKALNTGSPVMPCLRKQVGR